MALDFDVVELPPTNSPPTGERAPDFTRPLVNEEFWEDVSLDALTDECHVLLIFYPMDGAFPATYIWNEVRDRGWTDVEDLSVVGITVSTPYEHKQFIEDRGIDCRLFSDPQNRVARRYNIAHSLDGMSGIEEPRPAVFLLNGERRIMYEWTAAEWPDFPDYEEIEHAIEER